MEIVTKVMEKSWKFVGKNVYEPCIYQYTHMHVYISENVYVYILNIFKYNINYNNVNIDMQVNIYKIYTVCACIYINIINIHRTQIYYTNKLLFCMRLIVWQHYYYYYYLNNCNNLKYN